MYSLLHTVGRILFIVGCYVYIKSLIFIRKGSGYWWVNNSMTNLLVVKTYKSQTLTLFKFKWFHKGHHKYNFVGESNTKYWESVIINHFPQAKVHILHTQVKEFKKRTNGLGAIA